LKFVDVSGADGVGAALVNDCKHGYSAKGNTLYMSLIRSSMTPDPRPNDRPQSANWCLMPHSRNWRDAGVLQFAESFNHPLWATTVKANTNGELPASASMLSVDKPDVVITGVKRAEDDDDLVVRFYEAYGTPADMKLTTPLDVSRVRVVNFIEDELSQLNTPSTQLRPYEIQTLKIMARPGH
jgi:alpha-mannosidase